MYPLDSCTIPCAAAAFLAALWALYRLRLYQIAREFNSQLDGRVDERLRVARDLHDTLLQTFQAALIHMQAGYNLLARRPEKAAEAIQKAITTSADAIAEGREAIQNMRSSTVTKNDLAGALRVAGDQMAAEGSTRFDVTVQGSSRDVHPILRDEVYRIALEALRNAFKHSEAKAIEAERGGKAVRPLRSRWNARARRAHRREAGRVERCRCGHGNQMKKTVCQA
jgi:signal transduction histidine kinase